MSYAMQKSYRVFASRLAGLALLSLATLLAGCGNYAWNQKLTVTVQTPNGEKSGSAVVAVNAWAGSAFAVGGTSQVKLRGEAVMVDLGDGRYLFALLDGNTVFLPGRTFSEMVPDGGEKAWRVLEGMRGQKRNVPGGHWPNLVTFGNPRDPKSMKAVADLPEDLGAGYTIKSISLEITDEPATAGVIETVLPWVNSTPEPGFCAQARQSATSADRFCDKVRSSSFVMKES